MNKFWFLLKLIMVVVVNLVFSLVAQAQATRTWVSGVGDDVNPCSRTAPCKTYAGAISKTAKDGEISTLDPGGFGTVTITKSITINGGGGGQGYGSILASLTNGIIINITDPADVRKAVRIDGVNINGASTGLDGIRFIAGTSLHVENTLIDGFTGDGIEVNNTAAGATASLTMKNVTIRNCGGAGVKMTAAGTGLTMFAMDNVNISRSGTGVDGQNGSRGSIRNSMFAVNSNGIALSGATSNTEINIDSSLITGNTTGIQTNANTVARISRCLISQNVNALGLGGKVDTGGNNTIMGNGTNQSPNGTSFPDK